MCEQNGSHAFVKACPRSELLGVASSFFATTALQYLLRHLEVANFATLHEILVIVSRPALLKEQVKYV